MNKLDILLEHLNIKCQFYKEGACKFFNDDNYYYVNCSGCIRNCEIEELERKRNEN